MTKPTCRELLDRLHANCPLAECPACELNARVEKVLALHSATGPSDPDGNVCRECTDDWPCPTVRLLNGGRTCE